MAVFLRTVLRCLRWVSLISLSARILYPLQRIMGHPGEAGRLYLRLLMDMRQLDPITRKVSILKA